MSTNNKAETFLVQIGNQKNETHHAISTPLYFSTAYRHDKIGVEEGYSYTRTGNPTRTVLEEAIAKLEGGDQAFATSSGMAAIHLVFSLFEKGSHFISSRDIYGGSFRLFNVLQEKYDFEFSYWDGEDEADISELIKTNTKAIFIETPTNPLMQTANLQKVSAIARNHHILHIVDNTLYSPYIQRPIDEGADIVVHSATKYLAGHNDVLAGLVIVKGKQLTEELAFLHNSIGSVLSPYDCWNLIRGLKTLALRMNQHEINARTVKRYLESHPLVTAVYYPGRSGMLSFELTEEALVEPFLKALNIFTFAESLGGVESFLTYPTTQTHGDIPEDVRLSYGLSNRLLRASVGVEHPDDLIADLKQAFERVSRLEVKTI
ncbi:aminotransferase class I/II-fold pyridoxal phosphate-dependent enzyme [Ornithinibacillus gellani]|uniref:aminotransferase class I/II-fold pyridoxal phosphate-dependent enzyme n=1 Tax=Ornithinibacillus gellani TaxID=2293253 RepID=UPI000F4755FC|nr:aminotransferase class I/II-fold pyridoxal phosphate-dependent enzyme [Ornithinibacillus gellani]TQS74617.1 aminotransferase class I/II-fold pyridoxal phosphate-dependent enzyme [Ornithinibacillus gellani]